MKGLLARKACSVVVCACALAASRHEIPLRLVSNLPFLFSLGIVGGPRFDSRYNYQGPLPARCVESVRGWAVSRGEVGLVELTRRAYGEHLCRSLAEVVRDSFALTATAPGTRPKAKARPPEALLKESIPRTIGVCKAEPILLDFLSLLNLPGSAGPGVNPDAGAACVGLSAVKADSSYALKPFLNSFTMTNRQAVKRINEALQRDKNFPADFTYTSVQINGPDCQSRDHEDRNNLGLSLIVGLGRYEGGDLEILLDSNWSKLNIKGKYLLFDGSVTHRTADFQGERYSLVLFTHKCVQRAQEAQLQTLRHLGFRLHTLEGHRSYTEAETSGEDSDGLQRPPLGAGNTGVGPPSHQWVTTTAKAISRRCWSLLRRSVASGKSDSRPDSLGQGASNWSLGSAP